MTDWADEMAFELNPEWSAVSKIIIAAALRRAHIKGLREAADAITGRVSLAARHCAMEEPSGK